MDKKVEQILKKVSVKLSLVDDLEGFYYNLEEAIEQTKEDVSNFNADADRIMQEISDINLSDYIRDYNEVEAIQIFIKPYVQEFEDKANELGVDPSTLSSEYNKLKDLLEVNINDVINSEKNENYNKLENL